MTHVEVCASSWHASAFQNFFGQWKNDSYECFLIRPLAKLKEARRDVKQGLPFWRGSMVQFVGIYMY